MNDVPHEADLRGARYWFPVIVIGMIIFGVAVLWSERPDLYKAIVGSSLWGLLAAFITLWSPAIAAFLAGRRASWLVILPVCFFVGFSWHGVNRQVHCLRGSLHGHSLGGAYTKRIGSSPGHRDLSALVRRNTQRHLLAKEQ